MKSEKYRRDSDFFMASFNLKNKVIGEEVIGILHAGEYVLDERGYKHYFKQGEDSTLYVEIEGVEIPSRATYNDVIKGDWFLEKEFDPRKAMFDRPNEWVAKYYVEDEHEYHYLGFDSNEMCAVFNRCLEPKVTVWSINADIAEGKMLDQAISLDKNDADILAAMKVEEILNSFRNK